jgi:hypothetical protein
VSLTNVALDVIIIIYSWYEIRSDAVEHKTGLPFKVGVRNVGALFTVYRQASKT